MKKLNNLFPTHIITYIKQIHMVEVLDIQYKIKCLNETLHQDKLDIPDTKDIKGKGDDEKTIVSNFFLYLAKKKVNFTSSTDTLHPNLIKYLIDNNICKIKRGKK